MLQSLEISSIQQDQDIGFLQEYQQELSRRKQQQQIKNGKEFDWVKYKTEQCLDKECIFNDKKKEIIFPLLFDCEKYHNDSDKRRLIVVKDKNKFNYSRLFIKDTDKEDSRYCMNFFEYLYHPQNFRSKECPSLQNIQNGSTESNSSSTAATITTTPKERYNVCIYGQYCPYYHNQVEKNEWVTDLKSTKYMAAPKEKFSQSLLDDYNNIQSSNKQLQKLYEQMNAAAAVKVSTENVKGSTSEIASPEPKNESPILEKQSYDSKRQFNTENVLYDLPEEIERNNENNLLDPINESEERISKVSGDLNLQLGRIPKQEKGNKKKSYSPKSKTMVNLEQKEQKKKTHNETRDRDGSEQVQSKVSENNNGDSKFKQEANNLKKSNKKIQEILISHENNNRHSSSSLNVTDTKSKQDLDITKQTSRYTDLSSNDEYLKEFSEGTMSRYPSKTYIYKQDLGHESSTVEFKNYQKLSQCKIQKDMNQFLKQQEYGQYICGFLNHKGGTMYIGVHDEGWVDGICLNIKQKDWFNLHIDNVTSLIEPRLVVGEIRINFTEVIGKPSQNPKDSKNYVIELQVVKTNYQDIYFYENNAYIKKQSSLTKMSIQEIKQDLQVKIKKQMKAESNFYSKLFMHDDMSELESQDIKRLQKLEEKLLNVLEQVRNKMEEKK